MGCCRAIEIYDEEGEEWYAMLLEAGTGRFTVLYPQKEIVSLRVQFVGRVGRLAGFRNWLRAARGKPLLCLTENLTMDVEKRMFTFAIGFPYEDPIRIRIPSASEEEMREIEQDFKHADR